MRRKLFQQLTLLVYLAGLFIITCSPSQPIEPHKRISAVITAQIAGPVYAGNFYKGYLPLTDYAFWIEDADGNYIKTLRISKGAVNVAKTGIHANHLPDWQKATGTASDLKVANDSLSYVLPQYDGLTSASLKLKANFDTSLTLLWDFSDTNGTSVPEGEYYICLETANIKKDSIPGSGYVPATILSETSRSLVNTRRRIVKQATASAAIKTLQVKVTPLNGTSAIEVDASSSATK